MTKKIAIIDGNSLMHRAYHAVPPTMNAPDGTPTNAVFGFMSMLLKFIDVADPNGIICAFDTGRPAFRMEALERYKAQRVPMDNELRVQFPLIEELLESMNIPVVKIKGWEGDDILGTIAAKDEKLGYETLLVTGDKDAYQLATDKTKIVTTKKGISDIAIYGPDEVKERYGIAPTQIPDFLGLKGDPSDNIPGVSGIGEKTATKLLQQFDSLEGIYENLDQLKGKQLENLQENKEAAFVSRKVATIVCDLDIPLDLEKVAFPAFSKEAVSEAFSKLRFNAHLTKVLSLIGQQVSRNEAKLEWEPFVRDSLEARTFVETAIADNERLGLVLYENPQASLFEMGLMLAVGGSKGSALIEGDQVKDIFSLIVKKGRFAMLDVKKSLKYIYPADTSLTSEINESDLFAMDAFDLGLAGYILDSSAREYAINDLLDVYGSGMLPQQKDNAEKLAVEAAAAYVLVDILDAALEKDGSSRAYHEIDAPLIAVLTVIERTGAAIDVDHLEALGKDTKEKLETLRAEIYSSAGEEFNVDSPKQLSHILFDNLGLKPSKKTQTGFSTNATVLKELSNEHELPKMILQYRELAKIKSTYIDALPRMRGGDKRVHTTFNETVASTGRLSSSDPNLQNIPVRTEFGRQIRECFIPLVPGDKFVSADYSQIELRLLAHLSQDAGLIEAFTSGMDFHAQTASRVFGIPLDEITPQLRSRAKAVNFGIVYGQQAFGLSQSLQIPFNEAKDMIDRYFEAYPGVRTYLDETINDAKNNGYAITMFGRKRHIPELKAGNGQQKAFGERTAMNHPMQGSAADIIKLAMIEVQKRLNDDGYQAKMILQVHDELDFSAPEQEVELLSQMVKEVMEGVVELKVPLEVDVSSGITWSQAH